MRKLHSLLIVMMMTAVQASAQTYDLFNGGHEDAPIGFTVGYVNKTWRTNFDDGVFHENPWGDENKRLHGMQFGVVYQPCFPIGFGAHTGLFYELYISYKNPVVNSGKHDEFTEHDLYLPLHAMWRFPLSRDCSFSVYGGVAFNWAMYGSYNDYFWTIGPDLVPQQTSVPRRYQKYGNGEFPHHMNVQWEVGGQFKINHFQAGFTYSFGATNHDFYNDAKTRQDKINIHLSYVGNIFGDD